MSGFDLKSIRKLIHTHMQVSYEKEPIMFEHIKSDTGSISDGDGLQLVDKCQNSFTYKQLIWSKYGEISK